MRNKTYESIRQETPAQTDRLTLLLGDLSVRIHRLMKAQNLHAAALAERLDKRPSEVHKWLSGTHNFTLRSLARLEAELGAPLLTVPGSIPASGYDPAPVLAAEPEVSYEREMSLSGSRMDRFELRSFKLEMPNKASSRAVICDQNIRPLPSPPDQTILRHSVCLRIAGPKKYTGYLELELDYYFSASDSDQYPISQTRLHSEVVATTRGYLSHHLQETPFSGFILPLE